MLPSSHKFNHANLYNQTTLTTPKCILTEWQGYRERLRSISLYSLMHQISTTLRFVPLYIRFARYFMKLNDSATLHFSISLSTSLPHKFFVSSLNRCDPRKKQFILINNFFSFCHRLLYEAQLVQSNSKYCASLVLPEHKQQHVA